MLSTIYFDFLGSYCILEGSSRNMFMEYKYTFCRKYSFLLTLSHVDYSINDYVGN